MLENYALGFYINLESLEDVAGPQTNPGTIPPGLTEMIIGYEC